MTIKELSVKELMSISGGTKYYPGPVDGMECTKGGNKCRVKLDWVINQGITQVITAAVTAGRA